MSDRIRGLEDFLALLKGVKACKDGEYKGGQSFGSGEDNSIDII